MATPDTEPHLAPEPPVRHSLRPDPPNVQLSADGRVARRQRNRERVVDAYVELIQEGVTTPTADNLAQRAEVTARTVYRYLHEDDRMRSDIAERVVSTLLSPRMRDDIERESLHHRIDGFVSFRLDVYERLPIIRDVVHNYRVQDPIIASAVEEFRSIIREELSRCFAPELHQLDDARRHSTIVSMQVAVLFESIRHAYREASDSRGDVHAMLCWNFARLLSDSEPSLSPRLGSAST